MFTKNLFRTLAIAGAFAMAASAFAGPKDSKITAPVTNPPVVVVEPSIVPVESVFVFELPTRTVIARDCNIDTIQYSYNVGDVEYGANRDNGRLYADCVTVTSTPAATLPFPADLFFGTVARVQNFAYFNLCHFDGIESLNYFGTNVNTTYFRCLEN